MPDFVEFLSLNQFVDKKGQQVLIGKLNGLKLLIRENPFRWGLDYIRYVTQLYLNLGGEYRRMAVPRESVESITGSTDDATTHQSKKRPQERSPPRAKTESDDEPGAIWSGVSVKSQTPDESL